MEQQSPVKPDNIKPQEKMEIKSKYECYLSWHGEYCDNVPHINFCQFHEMELQKHNSQNGVKEGIVTILFFKVLLHLCLPTSKIIYRILRRNYG